MPNDEQTLRHLPLDVFLDTEGLAERYGIGSTKAKELVRSGALPASVVPGMVRIPLAALQHGRWRRHWPVRPPTRLAPSNA